LCDADGVYEIEPRLIADPNAPGGQRSVRYVTWMFTQNDYNQINTTRLQAIPGVPSSPDVLPRFVPSSATRLPNGNFLITNSYSGANPLFQKGRFGGEVFEVEPNPQAAWTARGTGTFAGFSVPAIINGSATAPSNRQQMGADSNTAPLEQPLFAARLF
jgi:hypothetical protein